MIYSLLANIILFIHLCYILFVIFGGFLMLRWKEVWKIHIPAVIWGFCVQYFVWMCPLTDVENYFRNLAGENGYANGFINHFLTSIIYPEISQNLHIFLAVILVLINLGIYFYVFRKKKWN